VDRAIAAAVGRAGKILAAADLSYEVLDPPSLATPLSAAAGLAGDRLAGVEERWTAWYAGDVGHVGLWLAGWPHAPVEALFAAVAQVPEARLSSAVTLYPPGTDGRYRVECVIRVAAGQKVLANTVAEVVEAARQTGARLRRLDGRHAVAAYATGPTSAG